MSTYTDKIGYTVRFGGPQGIQWIPNGVTSSSTLGTMNPAMATNPVGLIIEAAKAAALVLQWVELRQQTLLQMAQFEERRIPWLADMLLQWSSEVQNGQVRLDTALFFEREVTRLLNKVADTKLMDVPSSLLLQVERTAQGMSAVNQLLYGQLRAHSPNFSPPNQKTLHLVEYKPYWELSQDDKKMEAYLARIDQKIGLIGNVAVGWAFGIIGVAAWRFAVWKSVQAAAEKKSRLDEFHSLTSIALELRSLRAQLSYATLLPAQEAILTLPSPEPVKIPRPRTTKTKSTTAKKKTAPRSRS